MGGGGYQKVRTKEKREVSVRKDVNHNYYASLLYIFSG